MNAASPHPTAIELERVLEESRWLSSLAHRLIRDPGLADDLAQDTMIAALGAGEQPHPDRRRGWLATILRRKLVGRKREEARRAYRERVSARHEALPSTIEVGALLESERLLRDALTELNEPYRRVLTLRYREGLSAAEIARRDDEPAATVRSRLRTGLQQLRSRLEAKDQHWAVTLLPLSRLPSGVPGAVATQGLSVGLGSVAAVAAVLLVALVVPFVRELLQSKTPVSPPELGTVAQVTEAAPAMGAPTQKEPGRRAALDVAVPASAAVRAAPKQSAALVPGVLEITVVDPEGQPIVGAYAQRWDNDVKTPYSKASGADGRLDVSLPRQRARIESAEVLVRAPGWAAQRIELMFTAGRREASADVALVRAGTIHGTVHNPHSSRQGFGVVFVSPLPPELLKRLTNGASLKETSKDVMDLMFHGAWEATTRGSGAFALNDVPVGTRGQVIALNDDRGGSIGWSDVIEVASSATTELDPIIIRDPALEPKDTGHGKNVRVRLVLPQGADPDAFEVSAWANESPRSMVSLDVKRSTRTEYVVPCRPGEELTVTVNHRTGEFAALRREGVTHDSGEITFTVLEVPTCVIRVVDQGGAPMETFQMEALPGHSKPDRTKEPIIVLDGARGTVKFQPPTTRWWLRVTGPGGMAELGPFASAQYGGPDVVTLERPLQYRGTLRNGGQPCAGAHLHLREACAAGLSFSLCEVLTRAHPGGDLQSTVTAADGSFEFAAVPDSSYVLGVDMEGVCVGAFQLDGRLELSLELPPCGSLSGKVEAVHGDISDGFVTLSHELGLQRTEAFGTDGDYHFEDLPPGRWVLGETHWSYGRRWLEGPEDDGQYSVEFGPPNFFTTDARALPERAGLGVMIAADAAQTATLRIQTQPPIEVEGHLLIDGRRPRNRTIHFSRSGHLFGRDLTEQRWVHAGSGGKFRVRLPGSGKWSLESPIDHSSALVATVTVQQGQAAPLEIDFQTGTLIITGVSDSRRLSVVVEGAREDRVVYSYSVTPMAGAGSRRVFKNMLAGRVNVLPLQSLTYGAAIATGVLEPGGTLTLNLP